RARAQVDREWQPRVDAIERPGGEGLAGVRAHRKVDAAQRSDLARLRSRRQHHAPGLQVAVAGGDPTDGSVAPSVQSQEPRVLEELDTAGAGAPYVPCDRVRGGGGAVARAVRRADEVVDVETGEQLRRLAGGQPVDVDAVLALQRGALLE